jgi:NAD-dependent deacetylase
MDNNIITAIAEHLRTAERILFITGAGMSADSGLPTYRGIGGLYNDKLTTDDIPIEVALSGDMLLRRPEITWKYLMEIEKSCRGATFNQGHKVIAEIEQQKPGTWVLTQNIDGFHRAAGSHNLIEIHGYFAELYCTQCDYSHTVSDYRELYIPPKCPQCRSLVRPNVVLFGENLPVAAVETLYLELERGFDLVVSVGTTSVFPYIAQPVLMAKQQGIPTVEINPAPTHISHLVDYKLTSKAAESLVRLWERVRNIPYCAPEGSGTVVLQK